MADMWSHDMADRAHPSGGAGDAPIDNDGGKHVGFVVDRLLCTGCATCDAACGDDAISMSYSPRSGVYEPSIDQTRCTLCGLCVTVCPGFRLDLTQWPLEEQATERHPLIGPYTGIWRAYSADQTVRAVGASGGAVTEIIRHLFRTDRIDGAIVTRMNPESPLEAQAIVVETEQELLATQKSKYCPHPHNSILKEIVKGKMPNWRLAFVGLPSHVHGLRNLQRIFPHLRETVPYVLSLFTAHVPSKRATEFLLSLKGLGKLDVQAIDYRGDGIPGRLRIQRRDGAEVFVPHLHWSYWGHVFGSFFYPPREWLYADKLSWWADWSIGDNWQQYGTDVLGASTVVSRTPDAEVLVREMQAAGVLVAEPMSAVELIHDQGLENKLNIGVRLKVWRLLGGKVPDYKPALPVRWGDVPRTIRFALYVRLGMYQVPMWLLKPFLAGDYLLRKRAKIAAKTLLREAWRSACAVKSLVKALRIIGTRQVEQDAPARILMIGGYGWKDIGDESMPHADLLKLKNRLLPETRYIMASPHPADTATRHGERSVADLQELARIGPGFVDALRWSAMTCLFLLGVAVERLGWRMALWPEARGFLDELSSSHLLFNVGGGNLNSLTRGELYKKSVTYVAAAWLGVPVLVSGQTIGPFSRKSDSLVAGFALNRVRMITFRDKEESQRTIRQLGVYRPVLKDTADDAITLPAVPREEAAALLEAETGINVGSHRPSLLVLLNCKASLSIFKQIGETNDLQAETDVLVEMAERLLVREGTVVVFLSTDFTDSVDDRVVHREVYRRLSDNSRAFVLENEYSDQQLKGLIGLADLALGMRYHFLVFAAAEGVPFLGFASGEYQMRKLRGLANLLCAPDCYFAQDIEKANFEALWCAVENVLERREQIAGMLRTAVPALQQDSYIAVREAGVVLAGEGETG